MITGPGLFVSCFRSEKDLHMKVHFVVPSISALLLLIVTGLTPAVENKGADQLELYGGKRGKIPFPHHQHQTVLEDCSICHDIFPQEKGVIEKLKTEGKLKPKQVMNKLCTACHKEKKRAGEKTGPVTCKDCHVKD
jgi:hypothetical protein